MGEVWNSLWENCKNMDSVSIMNNPSGISLRSEFIGLLMKYFNLRNKYILEVGTGTGQDCIELALRGANCVGIDKSSESIKLAKRIANDYQMDNCIFEEKDIYDFNKSNFDMVFNMGVLEHFDDSGIVNMLEKMSKLGKYVIVGVPYSGSDTYKLSKLYSQKKKTWEYDVERDFWSLREYFEKAGMSLLHEQVIGLVNEAYYLRRVDPELISLQLSQNLSKLFNGNKNVGCWLIAIGSVKKKLEKKNPKEGVSIIIPVCNGEKCIEQSMKNLESLDYPNLEIIYINDGSLSMHEARYKGLKKANNYYILFLDSDDIVSPGCISNIMRDLKNCPENTHLLNSHALMENNIFTGNICYNRYLISPHDYISLELTTLSGQISPHTIMKKSSLLKAYNKLSIILKEIGVEEMKVAEDTLLLDIMLFSGLIEKIIPVYYSYYGHDQKLKSTLQQFKDRINDIPIQIAYCFVKLNEVIGRSEQREKEWENAIICQAIKTYGLDYGTIFVENFRKYKKLMKNV